MSSQLNPETVMEALKDVHVPGTRVDIVKIGLVGEIKVTGGEVVVSVVKTTEKDETIAKVREEVTAKVSSLPGVLSVAVPVDDRVAAFGGWVPRTAARLCAGTGRAALTAARAARPRAKPCVMPRRVTLPAPSHEDIGAKTPVTGATGSQSGFKPPFLGMV